MILGLMLLGFIVLIIAATFLNREPVLLYPDDRDRIAAERADREHNAYYILEQAQQGLPELPEPRLESEYSGEQLRVMNQSYSTSSILGVRMPLDDSRMLRYLEHAREAITLAHNAKDRPYFRYPIPSTSGSINAQLPRNAPLNAICTNWFVYAAAQIRYLDEIDAGIQSLDDLWTVLSTFRTEPFMGSHYPNGTMHIVVYFRSLHHLIRQIDNRDVLKKIDNMIRNHSPVHTDFRPILEAHMRLLDDAALAPKLCKEFGVKARLSIADHFRLFQFQQTSKYIIDNRHHYEEIIHLPLTSYENKLTSFAWYRAPYAGDIDSAVTKSLIYDLTTAHTANGMQPATRIVIALQRYHLDHNRYPERLDLLLPDYMDAIPGTPATTEGVLYEVADDNQSYVLEDDGLPEFDHNGRIFSYDSVKYVRWRDW